MGIPYFFNFLAASSISASHPFSPKTKKMKKLSTKVLTVAFILGLIHTAALAQQVSETFIRNLDNTEREAVLKGDTITLFNKLWSPNMVVNAPANRVGTVDGYFNTLELPASSSLSMTRQTR